MVLVVLVGFLGVLAMYFADKNQDKLTNRRLVDFS